MVLGDSQMSKRPSDRDWATVFVYNDAGCCSVIGEANSFDLINFDPAIVSPERWVSPQAGLR